MSNFENSKIQKYEIVENNEDKVGALVASLTQNHIKIGEVEPELEIEDNLLDYLLFRLSTCACNLGAIYLYRGQA